jgi:hypothetical protein
MISASWIENWERIVPFLAFPPDLRRAVYTTDESVKGPTAISRVDSPLPSVLVVERGCLREGSLGGKDGGEARQGWGGSSRQGRRRACVGVRDPRRRAA